MIETTVADGRTAVTVVRSDDESVTAIAEELQSVFRRERRVDSIETPVGERESVHVIVDLLTEKQRQAVELAYFSGYFERPRENNTTVIAAKLGVNRATFTHHLRAAESKVLSKVFDH